MRSKKVVCSFRQWCAERPRCPLSPPCHTNNRPTAEWPTHRKADRTERPTGVIRQCRQVDTSSACQSALQLSVCQSVSQAGSQPASQLAIYSTLAGAGIWHMLHATCTRSAIKYCTPRQCFQHCYSNNNNTTKNNTNKRNRSIAGMFHGQKYAAAVVVFVVVLSLIQLASTQRASA